MLVVGAATPELTAPAWLRTRLEDLSPDLELETAIAFARRRRLGPFAREAAGGKPAEKALAAFARAGFSSSVARRVLGARTAAELEQDDL